MHCCTSWRAGRLAATPREPRTRKRKPHVETAAEQTAYFKAQRPGLAQALLLHALLVSNMHAVELEAVRASRQRALEEGATMHHPCFKHGRQPAAAAPDPDAVASTEPGAAERAAATAATAAPMPAVPAASAAAEDAGRVPVQVQPPPPLQPQHAQPPQPPREQPSPLRSLPRRLPGVGEAVRCITLAGDFVLRVHEYHCDTCEQTFKPLATLAGCFPVCLTPPAGQVVWIEIRLLNVQKHLTSRGATFSGAQNIRLRACHAADVLPLQHFAMRCSRC
jgi:hypothetical protein